VTGTAKFLLAFMRNRIRTPRLPGLKLRTRLFMNLTPFVILLLGIGGYAIVLFSKITTDVDVTVTENYRSVRAVQQMKLSLYRMEEGVLLAMDDNSRDLGRAVFEENRKSFEEQLNRQLHNTRLAGEPELNRELSSSYASFKKSGTQIFSLNQQTGQREAFQKSLMPGLLMIDKLLDEIYKLNHEAILSITPNVEKITRDASRLMIICMIVAMCIASYACYRLARAILVPIQSLTRATAELGKGNLEHPVPVLARDELGALAESFNAMAGQLREFDRNMSKKIIRMQRAVDATLASFPDPVFVLNRDGKVELTNPAAVELERLLGLGHSLPERLQELAHEALETGRNYLPHSFKEVMSFRLYGKDTFFLPRILAMRDEQETLFGVAVVLHDVTRFRLLDDAKTNLVSTVSHEIKTPLTSVRMVLHLLLEKTLGPLTPRQNELLVTARDDAERLLHILNDLLDLTRLEEGNNDLHREMTMPTDLVQGAADLVREALKPKELALTCQVEPGLPPVLVDRARLNHVFTNLLNNAIKYSPLGGEIRLSASLSPEHAVQFGVADRGPGVPEDFQDRIFDRFFRVPEQTKTGAGLGLSIAREIVVAHGGRIGVKNRRKKGCEFYFVLAGAEDGLLF